MTGDQFEDLFQEKLEAAGIEFIRERKVRSYGHKASNGKHDFKLKGCRVNALELKHVMRLSSLGIAWAGSSNKAHIKAHQLKALRNAGKPHEAGLLIYEGIKDYVYWVTIHDLDSLIIANGLMKTFGNGVIDGYDIDLDEFVGSLKGAL